MNHCLFKAKDTKGAVGNTVDYSSLTLAVKFLTASRVCVAKVGAGIKKEPPLREALGEISFAVIFLHKESFGSSTSLMPYK